MGETFGALLKRYRDRAGWTGHHLAVQAGFDHSTISRFEAGTRFPTNGSVWALSVTLGLDTADRSALLVAAGYWPGETGAVLVLDALHAARAAGVGNKWG
jgi:transcriptional regulator with XRE-family HTH domain